MSSEQPTVPRRVTRDEPHWYHVTYSEGCVICGRGSETIRKRMAGTRPADLAECHKYDGSLWACGEHFA